MKVGKYTNMSTNSTAIASDVPCVLVGVVINNQGASSNTLTIYDNTAGSGTVVALIDTTEAKDTLTYHCILKTGCTAVMGTGTAADVTIITS